MIRFRTLWLGGCLGALLGGPAPQAKDGLIRNPGFEGPTDGSGWTVHVYGAQPDVALDSRVFHGGGRSLRIASGSPTDTALGQEVTLKPNAWYRFTGWVKTDRLDPRGSSTSGTFQIQNPGGAGVIARGASHSGYTDWTEVPILFHTPPDGRVRVAVFFVGFGKGTGTAWFDDIALKEVQPGGYPVKVTREPHCPGTISPFQYGQFVEYLCDLVPSMWAEKLYDGSFEGLSPYKFEYIRETDFKEKPWYPSGATNRATFARDRSEKISGDLSLKIEAERGAPAVVGISQDGISIRRDEPCKFSVWARGRTIRGPVRIRLSKEHRIIAAHSMSVSPEWTKYEIDVRPDFNENDATITIEFTGPGTLWLDNASLMPFNTVGGWRRDVVAALQELKPGIIRFGGSTLDDPNLGDFEWKDTVGVPDRRKPFRAWGGLQKTGPGLAEFIDLCRRVDAEPLICVRYTKRTPKDAADEVEYFNGAVETPMGAVRAKNGHPKPYRVKYWQVGNEIGSADYPRRLADFCRAMKAVDPSIKLLSSFPTPEVLKSAGQYLDYLCPHHYGCDDLQGKAADFDALREMIRRYAPGRPIKIAVTEWNTTAGDMGPRRAMLWTLSNALACARYHNLMHRRCDIVEIANRSNLINSFCSGIIQADTHHLYKTPTFYSQELYARYAGTRPLKLASELPVDQAPDFSATLSRDGKTVTIFAVNDTLAPIKRTLDLTALHPARDVLTYTLTDKRDEGQPDVANSFAGPDRVSTVAGKLKMAGLKLEYNFPALSLTLLRFRVGNDR